METISICVFHLKTRFFILCIYYLTVSQQFVSFGKFEGLSSTGHSSLYIQEALLRAARLLVSSSSSCRAFQNLPDQPITTSCTLTRAPSSRTTHSQLLHPHKITTTSSGSVSARAPDETINGLKAE